VTQSRVGGGGGGGGAIFKGVKTSPNESHKNLLNGTYTDKVS
jgi:hypothetical protein